MNLRFPVALGAALSTAATAALAAEPKYLVVDHSTASLIDAAAVEAIFAAGLPTARLAKVYPVARWGFASQVEGGLTAGGQCVVTARVMLLPTTLSNRQLLVFKPERMSTAFDAQPGLSKDKCGELAAAKLKESLQSVVSGLVKP